MAANKFSMFSERELDAYKRKEAIAIIQAQKGFGDIVPIATVWAEKAVVFRQRCAERYEGVRIRA